jgi:hypothetical protein
MQMRVLRQFSRSPVFQQTLIQLGSEVQELSEAIQGVLDGRVLAVATGVQLDIIGRIVGQGRSIPYYTVRDADWFTPDVTSFDLDTVWMWVQNGIDGDAYLMTDSEYRDMIKAKIYRNRCKTGSAAEIMAYAQMALGIPVSAIALPLGDIEIQLPIGTPVWKMLWAKRFITDNRGDVIPIMPYPCTSLVTTVTYI